jgi:hypothetical protein
MYLGPSIYDEHFGDGDRCPMYSTYEELHNQRADEAAARLTKIRVPE